MWSMSVGVMTFSGVTIDTVDVGMIEHDSRNSWVPVHPDKKQKPRRREVVPTDIPERSVVAPVDPQSYVLGSSAAHHSLAHH